MSEPPAPLTPADCDLTDFAFMPLEVARLRDSELASNESPEACWAAVLLWAASWHQVPAASVPDDDKWLAKAAGYGRVVKEWLRVKEGAMRGFELCADGRLYHPVVAEKAREAWLSKLRHRWGTECARIKKHNERHDMSLPKPTFEQWRSDGCPQGHALPVTRDKPPSPESVAGEAASKGQGEGQRQGQGESSSDLRSGDAAAPPPVDKSTKTEDKRAAWRTCGAWMVENGIGEDLARTVMGKVIKDFPAVAIDAMVAAPKNGATPDPKAYLVATAQRLAGSRNTVPSDDAEKTKAYLAEQAAHSARVEAERLARLAVRAAEGQPS